MPENTPMKMQWTTIDGRSTPIVLPQIWDHDKRDWVVTSTENPLPTQLTGSNVEEVFIERFIFNEQKKKYHYLPKKDGYTSAVVSLNVHGATGDYSQSGDGLRVRLYNYSLGEMSVESALGITTERINNDQATILFFINTRTELRDAERRSSRLYYYESDVPIQNQLSIFLDLIGNVGDGEGYDISAKVLWIA